MKNILGLFLIFCAQLALAQEPVIQNVNDKQSLQDAMDNTPVPDMEKPSQDENKIYNSAEVEVKAEFPGGMDKFQLYVAKNFAPTEKGLKGKVFLNFVVEKDGSLTDIKVLREIGNGTGKDAIRVLRNGPKWIPAYNNGKKVRSSYTVPIAVQSKE